MDTIKKYEKLCKKSVKLNTNAWNTGEGSNEDSHIHQDKVYRTFVNDICSGKLKSLNNIKSVANMIKKDVVKYDIGRWYA
jgi:hypothetical protein